MTRPADPTPDALESHLAMRSFESPKALAEALADEVAAELSRALDDRPQASLVVSGGSTPRLFFEALATRPLDWRRVLVTLADERWVPPDDAASNQGLLVRHLLRGEAASARLVPLWSDSESHLEAARRAEKALAALPRPFDVVVLGMGTDGHVASLFPQRAAGMSPSDPAVVAVDAPTGGGHPRLSLSLPTLLDSRRLVLHLVGDAKRRVLRRILEPGAMTESPPIRAVVDGRRAQSPEQDQTQEQDQGQALEVFWAPSAGDPS